MMFSSPRMHCFFACVVTYILAAHKLWPMGLWMGVLPAIMVGLVTKRLIERTSAIDRVVEDLVRRGGGDF